MSEINFDDLQAEISAAEKYLKQGRVAGSASMRSSYAAPSSTSRMSSTPVENVSMSADFAQSTAWAQNYDKYSNQKNIPSQNQSNNDVFTPDSIGIGIAAAGDGDGDSDGDVYSQPIEPSSRYSQVPISKPFIPAVTSTSTRYATEEAREQLIARLLAEHGAIASTSTSNSVAVESSSEQKKYTNTNADVDVPEAWMETYKNKANDATIESYTSKYELELENSMRQYGADTGTGTGTGISTSIGDDVSLDDSLMHEGAHAHGNTDTDTSRDGDEDGMGEILSPSRPGTADTLFFASDLDDQASTDVHGDIDIDGVDFQGTLLRGLVGGSLLHGDGDGDGDGDDIAMAVTIDRNVRLNMPNPQSYSNTNDRYSNSDNDNDSDNADSDDLGTGIGGGGGYSQAHTQMKGCAWTIDDNDKQNSNLGPINIDTNTNTDTDSTIFTCTRIKSQQIPTSIPQHLKDRNINYRNTILKQFKYVKTREECMIENENKIKNMNFQPILATKTKGSSNSKVKVMLPKPYIRKVVTQQQQPRSSTAKVNVKPAATRVSTSTSTSTSAIQERINKNIKAHEIQLKNRQKLKEHIDALELNACTFQPTITKMASKILSKKENIEKKLGIQSLDSQYMNEQQYNTTNTNTNTNTNDHDSSRMPVSERLYSQAKINKIQQEFLHQQVETERNMECTFQPEINANTKAMYTHMNKKFGMTHIPIHERVVELQKYKTKRLHDLRSAIEEQESELMSFTPVIDSKSRMIADRQRNSDIRASKEILNAAQSQSQSQNYNVQTVESGVGRDRGVDIADRLLEEARAVKIRKQELTIKLEQEQTEKFKPIGTSIGSNRLAQKNLFVGATFSQRQAMYDNIITKKEQERIRDECNITSKWFQPNIGKSNDIIAQCKPERIVETIQERTERLYRTDQQIKNYKIKTKEIELYKDMTFIPKIDNLSKHLGQTTSLDELVDNTKGKNIKKNLKKKVEAEYDKECTFQPIINDYVPEGHLIGDQSMNMNMNNETSGGGGGIYSWQGQLNASVGSVTRGNTNTNTNNSMIMNQTNNSVIESKKTINMRNPEKMASQIRSHLISKEEKRRHALMAKEIDELKNCTFTPKINPPMSITKKANSMILINDDDNDNDNDNENNSSYYHDINDTTTANGNGNSDIPVIHGLGRYLELKVMQIKKNELQEKRENDVFHVKNLESYRRPEDGGTIIQPFNLSSRDLRPSRAIEEMKEKVANELTFVPNTEMSRRRQTMRSQARAVF